jgi:two-component system cell cycle sensor histidine kinase/response regulator CckA
VNTPVSDKEDQVTASDPSKCGPETPSPKRMQSKKALRKSEENWRAFADCATDWESWIGPDGEFLWISPSVEGITGYSAAEILAMPDFVSTLIVAEERESFTAAFSEARDGGKGGIVELRCVHKNGATFWLEVSWQSIFDTKGNPLGLRFKGHDVTRRRAVDESLRRTQFSLDRSQDLYHWMDIEGRFLYVNDASCRRLGYSREELLSMTVHDIDPIAPRPWSSHFQEVKERGVVTFETSHLTKDGEVFPVEVTVNYVSHNNQEYMWSSVHDITKRKEAERELRLAQVSIDYSGDYVLWLSQDARLLNVNASLCTRLGYSRDELLAMPIFDIDMGQTREAWSERWRKAKNMGPHTFETEFRTRDGEIFPVEIRSVSFPHEGQVYNCGIARDISERRRAEQERLELERRLQHSQKLESLAVLAGGVAHDFNNILTSVLGNAEIGLSELSLSHPARENLQEIVRSSRRAAALCRQMLAYSGRGHFVIEPIDLGTLIEGMLGLLKSTVSKKALIRLNLEKDLPLCEGDPSQLSQVIMNLVLNASEALDTKEGTITISTGVLECSPQYLRETHGYESLAPGLYLTLEVTDTGPGMDKATQERIFEPFFTTKFTGRGLGLAAVLGIVRGHRGALRVYSELGRGTTFKILLPALSADVPLPARDDGAAGSEWQGEGTILLVDDEQTILAAGARMLASLGFTVLTAADGREALAIYAQHRDEITLVLLDLAMPHMDGEETFRELRLVDPGVRVVMSSGYTEHDVVSRFTADGLLGFVQKPYSLAELAAQLQAALEGCGTVT